MDRYVFYYSIFHMTALAISPIASTIISFFHISLHLPFVHCVLAGIKADADLHHPSAVGEIRLGMAAGIDLLKGMTRRIVHLQLHEINGVGHEDDHICSPARHLHLHAHVDYGAWRRLDRRYTHRSPLRSSLSEFLLKALHIGDAGKAGLHVTHGQVDIALLECSPEF